MLVVPPENELAFELRRACAAGFAGLASAAAGNQDGFQWTEPARALPFHQEPLRNGWQRSRRDDGAHPGQRTGRMGLGARRQSCGASCIARGDRLCLQDMDERGRALPRIIAGNMAAN